MDNTAYTGRFAPSPTGPLHMGSLVAAMASYLDARVHDGTWLVRIEDIDEARAIKGADEAILQCLQAFGMRWDGEVLWQSRRKALYEAAFARLGENAYPCGCTRREIADSRIGVASDGAAVYPGTCRGGLAEGKTARAYRLRIADACRITFTDRWQGEISQHLPSEAGDFVLRRADGFWAYQLAVVVDDADQQVTDIVRGADLLDSTPRQIYLQRLLGMPTPRYLHVPVVTNSAGEKLSKQTGALALDTANPLPELLRAAAILEMPLNGVGTVEQFWQSALQGWHRRFGD
ncbi:tRNA glutamyl-Q(34) synthetase GluQRS [Noviherbaspirillum aerium]|uniref:tRNA glutamyl-Q(34) synthetase GluQRS n=1 Tax=Noviherbaspirillum aerium TaxID=2588497 RepID=UPI00124E020A|nr:tRNA glutamyl-Q(34) synthetase GluQRS [Noviherbaspirillum aerium]